MKKITFLLFACLWYVSAAYAEQVVVSVEQAGTLSSHITADQQHTTESLKVVGKINGADIALLREMAGISATGEETQGQLKTLDLSEARIVKGGTYYTSFSGKQYVAAQDTVGDYMFYKTKLTRLVLPTQVTAIRFAAFMSCAALTEVVLSNNLQSIDDYAFASTSIQQITLPNTLTTIGKNVFNGSQLTSITVPASVKQLGKNSFSGCKKLTTVKIEAALEAIEDNMFLDCSQLQEVKLPKTIYAIRSSCFENCTALANINLPQDLLYIDDAAFKGCTALEHLVLPSAVSNIKERAFMNCKNLTSIVIPNSVNTFGRYAFYGCKSLAEIHLLIDTPPVYKNFPFDRNFSATLYVPEASIESYKDTNPWNRFKEIKSEETSAVKSVLTTPQVSIVGYYTLGGQRLTQPTKGVNIIRYTNGTSRKVWVK